MIKQITCGLLLGLILIIIALPHDPFIQEIISDGFKQAFADALDCTIECTIDEINLWKPGLKLSNVTVTPRNGATGWRWTAKKYNMHCTWWHLIRTGTVNLYVDMDTVDANSQIINGELAMLPHMQKMAIGDPNVPMAVEYINLQNASFAVADAKADMAYRLIWNSKTVRYKDRLESAIEILDGNVTHQLRQYINALRGTLSCGVNETGNPELVAEGVITSSVNHIVNQPLHNQCKISWNMDKGSLEIIHDDAIMRVNKCKFKTIENILYAHIAVDFQLDRIGALPCISIPLRGKGSAIIDMTLDAIPRISSKVTCANIGYHHTVYVPELLVDLDYNDKKWSGVLHGQTNQGPLEMRLKSDDNNYKITGAWQEYVFDAVLSYDQQLTLDHAMLADAQKNTIVAAHSKEGNYYAQFNLQQCSALLKKYLSIDMQAQGTLQTQLAFNNNQICCAADMEHGFIRIPETFNGITAAQWKASFDTACNIINIDHAQATLNEGTISCNHAFAKLTSDGSIESYYANAIVDHILFNVLASIDLYCSGNIILQKKVNQNPLLSGSIILDEFQLRENPLSTSFITKIAHAASQPRKPLDIAMDCDLSLVTKKPIQVITPWIQLMARANVSLKNTIANPEVSGSVCLDNGILYLPYKPLIISQGLVTFDPHHIDNPFIELTAQNTIKYHDVSMQIAGPLQQLHISLLSNPVLSESQIVALLLNGSTHGSLGTIIPSLALYSIKNLLFDIEQSPIRVSEYTQEWIKPLRSVYFVPIFDDQRARGGLRGAFEIEVTDRIHALIQKNFTLTEDTRFEIEYALSDNVNIRAVRDERRDVNGQIEMRWKF